MRATDTTSFWQAHEACDTRAMADYLLAHREELLVEPATERDPLASVAVLLYEGWRALRGGDAVRADTCFDAGIAIIAARGYVFWLDYFKGKGMAAYLRGAYPEALAQFERFAQAGASDPEALVYYGNTLLHLGRAKDARPLFLEAATHGAGDAPLRNFLLTLGGKIETGDAAFDRMLAEQPWVDRLAVPPLHEIPRVPLAETFAFPIFINCRDRLTCLRYLVTWLLQAGYTNLYLLDNASTYPPLLAYYESLADNACVTVVRLGQNFGYQALWASNLLQRLDIRTPYVYTDPDVLPTEDCPRGVIARLYQILQCYPWLDKVGLGLVTEDLPPAQAQQKKKQALLYHVPLGEELWYAPVDTTFALYAPIPYYTIAQAIRTTGRLMARHLPWYLDHAHLPEDEAYYAAHANEGSNFAKDVNAQSAGSQEETK